MELLWKFEKARQIVIFCQFEFLFTYGQFSCKEAVTDNAFYFLSRVINISASQSKNGNCIYKISCFTGLSDHVRVSETFNSISFYYNYYILYFYFRVIRLPIQIEYRIVKDVDLSFLERNCVKYVLQSTVHPEDIITIQYF